MEHLQSLTDSIIIKLLASCLERGDFLLADFAELLSEGLALKCRATYQPPREEVRRENQCLTINILNLFQ